jgi:hypothetical protein
LYWNFRLQYIPYIRECSKLHNDELNELYSSPNIVRVIRLRRIGWAGHVARKGGEERRIEGSGGEY